MIKICLIASLALPVIAHGQSTQSTAKPPFTTVTGAFFALSVSDLMASVKWYSEKLGLDVVMETPKQDNIAVTVLEGGGLIVELIANGDAVSVNQLLPGIQRPDRVHGIFKVGLIVDDFDGTIARLNARGVPFFLGPYKARKDQPANVIIRDNSGNLIQLFGKRLP